MIRNYKERNEAFYGYSSGVYLTFESAERSRKILDFPLETASLDTTRYPIIPQISLVALQTNRRGERSCPLPLSKSSLPKVCLASERHLTFRGERTKVTAQPGRFFNFTLLLRDDTSNDAGPPRERATQSGSNVNARPWH